MTRHILTRRIMNGVLLLLLFVSVGCGDMVERTQYGNRPVAVTYRVSGAAKIAEIRYANGEGGTNEETAFGPTRIDKTPGWLSDRPWEKTVSIPPGEVASISAQIPNRDRYGYAGENIKVEILVDGKVVKSAESNGESAIADAAIRNQ
jgi:hypothetical protein